MNTLLTTVRPYFDPKLAFPKIQAYDLSDTGRMPESPNGVKPQISATSSGGSVAPVSNHKVTSGMNGAHSAHSTPSGRTPSPPTTTHQSGGTLPPSVTTVTAADLPLGCNVRQLSKVKRFLTTLQQFGMDISPEVGERIHGLILGLVNSTISIEEFHQKIQDVTNYPLRPFVIPFLKSHLPLLQTELLHFARMAKQTPQQYLRQHEQLVIDPATHPGGEPFEIFQAEAKENGKRRTPPDQRPRENGYSDNSADGPPPAKRHQPLPSPTLGARISPAGPPNHVPTGMNFRFDDNPAIYRERDRYERYERYERSLHREYTEERDMEDEWKNIHTMLNCILGMVEKTKRALAILQHRSQAERSDFALWGRRHVDGPEFDMKKRTNELMAHYKMAEDRVCEVRRRAVHDAILGLNPRQPPLLSPPEDAMNEVKRQAVAELQKAVSAAESKASEVVAAERAKMEQMLSEARRQAAEEALAAINHQEDSTESCWNCGRKANETCSGCNVARYCGAFCQHKDWENHHRVCGEGPGLVVSSSSLVSQGPGTSPVSLAPTTGAGRGSPSPPRTATGDVKPAA